MKEYKKGEIYPLQEEDGIWMDYHDYCWYFMIKDSIWQKEEIRRTEHSEITISFIQKGIADAFLLSIYDCMEPSDIPFSILDGDQELIQSIHDRKDYTWQIVLLNEDNRIAAVRRGKFTHDDSMSLKQAMRKRLAEPVSEDALDSAIAKMEMRYEPYELESYAVFTEKTTS